MSISRYCPPIGTAGFDRSWVSGNRRLPWPPPRMSARTSLFTSTAAANGTPGGAGCNVRVRWRKTDLLQSSAFQPASGVSRRPERTRLAFRLIPREEKFYSDFQALADELKVGARLLEAMLAPDRPDWNKADEIKGIEHKCDALTHAIIQRLHRTFVTPLDREDVHALARSLDDVMDAIDDAAAIVRLYRLDRIRFGARELAQIVTASTDSVRLAIDDMEQRKGLLTHALEVSRLEKEADRTHQEAVSRLFEDEKDPLMVLKWKETFDFLENAMDRCEDVANVIEGVQVKHG